MNAHIPAVSAPWAKISPRSATRTASSRSASLKRPRSVSRTATPLEEQTALLHRQTAGRGHDQGELGSDSASMRADEHQNAPGRGRPLVRVWRLAPVRYPDNVTRAVTLHVDPMVKCMENNESYFLVLCRNGTAPGAKRCVARTVPADAVAR